MSNFLASLVMVLATGLIKETFGHRLLSIVDDGIGHSMALVTGLVNEMFGHRLVVIWLWFGHTRLVRMWSVNIFLVIELEPQVILGWRLVRHYFSCWD